ncbi:MAG TPA: metallophosphoesterase [Candidatus Obscuribacterales bacterium]
MRYDVIGDVHGCIDELNELLEKLGYIDGRHPDGRKLVFVGDLVDRGPDSAEVLSKVMALAARDLAVVVSGNHDNKLMRYLKGNKVRVSPRLQSTIDQIESHDGEFKADVLHFLASLPIKFEDDGLLIVHGAARFGAGRKEEEALALYGEVIGRGEHGIPLRGDKWAHEYSGPHRVVVRGHQVVPAVSMITSATGAHVYNIDTGCVFGGQLSALRYPEEEVVQVAAKQKYCDLNNYLDCI